jgi:hypothetical protein
MDWCVFTDCDADLRIPQWYVELSDTVRQGPNNSLALRIPTRFLRCELKARQACSPLRLPLGWLARAVR